MSDESYNPAETEPKWREYWISNHLHEARDDDPRPKYYCLDMFPYPSGSGLHVGHWRSYVLPDCWSRYKRLQGFNVLHPMGWDAFGSPAENDAIQKGIHPRVGTQRNIENFKRQLHEIGAMYDWSREVKTMQTNWIGRSEGAVVTFTAIAADGTEHPLKIFTTRPDTLFGATYMVMAPEHPLVPELTSPAQARNVQAYVETVKHEKDIDRAANIEKTGVFTGAYALNPVNGEKIPIWIADYVLMAYGTGAIMAVPAHDERDYEFAKKFGLEIREVISSKQGIDKEAFIGEGT